MPSSYTHQHFAKKSIQSFPQEIQNIVLKYEKHFFLGALGPDPLYFYGPLKGNPLYSLGDEIHNDGIYQTLMNNRNIDDEELSYLFGYISHYILDKNCHEYIYKIDKDNKLHHIIEAEIDKRLALEDMKSEEVSFVSRMNIEGAHFPFIQKILRIDEKKYLSSVKSMKRLTNFLMSTNPLKRFFTRVILSSSPRFRKYKQIMYSTSIRHDLDDIVNELFRRIHDSYDEYLKDVISYYEYIKGRREDIDFGYDMSFEGDKIER